MQLAPFLVDPLHSVGPRDFINHLATKEGSLDVTGTFLTGRRRYKGSCQSLEMQLQGVMAVAGRSPWDTARVVHRGRKPWLTTARSQPVLSPIRRHRRILDLKTPNFAGHFGQMFTPASSRPVTPRARRGRSRGQTNSPWGESVTLGFKSSVDAERATAALVKPVVMRATGDLIQQQRGGQESGRPRTWSTPMF